MPEEPSSWNPVQCLLSDKLVPDKLGRYGHVTIGAGRDFPQFPTVQIHSSDRQVNHNSHLSQSLYASCTREYATPSRGYNEPFDILIYDYAWHIVQM